MFFHRRRRPLLLELMLVLLGVLFLAGRRHCDEGSRAEMRGKARLFRSKLREAFGVWFEEEKPEPQAPASEG